VPEKTVSRSFRMNENSFLALEEEAKKHNISLNTLVNQIFDSYANFDRYLMKLGMLKISKVSYMKILNAAPDNEIIEAAKEVAQNSARVNILARYGTMSLTGALNYLKNLGEYGYYFEYNEVLSQEGKRAVTLIHSLGPKFSVHLEAYVKALFAQVDMVPKMKSTENSVTFEL
jgi:predicted DNA-binding ribbon-helix-helix protein